MYTGILMNYLIIVLLMRKNFLLCSSLVVWCFGSSVGHQTPSQCLLIYFLATVHHIAGDIAKVARLTFHLYLYVNGHSHPNRFAEKIICAQF